MKIKKVYLLQIILLNLFVIILSCKKTDKSKIVSENNNSFKSVSSVQFNKSGSTIITFYDGSTEKREVNQKVEIEKILSENGLKSEDGYAVSMPVSLPFSFFNIYYKC